MYATVPPVATLKPGDTLALVKGDNPLTGPFAIAGAEPGDTLVVRILNLTVDSDRGVGTLARQSAWKRLRPVGMG